MKLLSYKKLKMIGITLSLIGLIFLYSGFNLRKTEKQYDEKIVWQISEIVHSFAEKKLSIKKIKEILGDECRLTNRHHDKINEGRVQYFESLNFDIRFAYKTENERKNDTSPFWVIFYFKKNNGLPVSILIRIFGKWSYFSKEAEQPKMTFEYNCENNKTSKKINITASGIFSVRNEKNCNEYRVSSLRLIFFN